MLKTQLLSVIFIALSLTTNIQPMGANPPTESELYVRRLMCTERGPVESGYMPVGRDEYEESPWFALRILLPIRRTSSFEYSAAIGELLSLNVILMEDNADERIRFLSTLRSKRPDISYQQLAVIYILFDSVKDLDGNDLFTSQNFRKYLNILCEDYLNHNSSPLVAAEAWFMDFFENSSPTAWVQPFFSEVISCIDRDSSRGITYTGYQQAFDFVLQEVSTGLPLVRNVWDIPRKSLKLFWEGIEVGATVTGRVIARHGDTALDSGARSFGTVVGTGAGYGVTNIFNGPVAAAETAVSQIGSGN